MRKRKRERERERERPATAGSGAPWGPLSRDALVTRCTSSDAHTPFARSLTTAAIVLCIRRDVSAELIRERNFSTALVTSDGAVRCAPTRREPTADAWDIPRLARDIASLLLLWLHYSYNPTAHACYCVCG